MMQVLGIETSCDETAVAIYNYHHGLLAHQIYSQIEAHAEYGGVVPELASRDHIRKTLPLIEQVMAQAAVTRQQIAGIAYTKGPGLIGALMVGASIGRSLGYALQVPTIGVHHLEAHLMAVMLEENKPSYPFLALLVSGGHTQLITVQEFGRYQLLGQSLDDAVGEAFDKTAKLLGLPYPGGPHLAALAEKGNSKRFYFPRPMINQPGLDFSFSGLKTYAMNCYRNNQHDSQTQADIACAFEDAVVDTLLIKTKRALQNQNLTRVVIVGGVGANKKLRQHFQHEFTKKHIEVFYPRTEFCTDNAAMVAYTGCSRLQLGQHDDLTIDVRARWPIDEL